MARRSSLTVLATVIPMMLGLSPAQAQFGIPNPFSSHGKHHPDKTTSDNKNKANGTAGGADAPATDYQGPKLRLAVTDLANKVTSTASDATPPDGFEKGLTEMLTTELAHTGRFVMVERKDVDKVIQEQTLGAGGLVTPATAAKMGKLLGAQFLVSGAVTQFSYVESNSDSGIHIGPIDTKHKESKAQVGLDIRLIDATTGEVVDAEHGDGQKTSSGTGLTFTNDEMTVGSEGFTDTPLGQASLAAIHAVVTGVLQKMADVPWEGHVADIDSSGTTVSTIYINAGSNAGLKVGDLLTVLHPGQEIKDPVTQKVIGRKKDRLIGQCQVTSISDDLANATPMGAAIRTSDLLVGDLVQLAPAKKQP